MEKEKKSLKKKQPVVVLVGHIDHGKSSILSKIRDFKITEKEVGGITQHIGAYEIEEKGQKITFIDTPGHEAFSAMRARGAKVADIAILVVAADEGIKPQTKEAIDHIKKAKIPMIVALNKVDKPNAQPERVKDGLVKEDILLEDRGGQVPSVQTSAETGKGINGLVELILLVSEMEGFEADINRPAYGVVIESYLDAKRGPVATLLLEAGILKEADIVRTNSTWGKLKRLENFQGKKIQETRPGQPVLVLGFNQVPGIGEEFKATTDLEQARAKIEPKELKLTPVVEPKPEQRVLNLIIKTDVLGSIEPIEQVLKNLPQEKIILQTLKTGVGDINLSDIKLAEDGRTTILGFRVKTSSSISEIARQKNIRILSFDLIYDLVEGVRNLMEKTLAPEKVRTDLGKLKALLIFRTEKKRQIVGARVLEGEIKQGDKIEVFRPTSPAQPIEELGEEEKIGRGKVVALQKDKKEIGKGSRGDEVGILFEGDVRVQEEDILVNYEEKRQKGEL